MRRRPLPPAIGRAPSASARYALFREMWAAANPGPFTGSLPSADQMDGVLHAERLDRDRRKRTFAAPLSELPPGVIVADSKGLPYLYQGARLLLWEPGGYARSIPAPRGRTFQVLTPRSIVRALAKGYPVAIHASAG